MIATRPALATALLVLLAGPGCSDDGAPATDLGAADTVAPVDAAPPDGPLPRTFGGKRPVTITLPAGYDGTRKWPLVLVLHGYGASGFMQETLLGYRALAPKAGFFLASPDGTVDSNNKRFWNATDACCDFGGTGVDDVAYLTGLIDAIGAVYSIDPDRVYLIGHSNGGFMAYRMACERAGRLAAVISLAGATYDDTTMCKPDARVSVVQIHGDQDGSVKYTGGTIGHGASPAAYPGAVKTTSTWAGYNGCGATRQVVPPSLDLDSLVAGAETVVERFDGCPAGVDVELWTIHGGAHLPIPTEAFATRTWAFFKAHPRVP